MKKREPNQVYAEIKLNESRYWESNYQQRILRILQQKGIQIVQENLQAIVNATSFRELSQDPEFKPHCPCYRAGKPCHDKVEDLNCFLCNCPNYETDLFYPETNGDILLGRCKANSQRGKYFPTPQFPEVKIWDCSDCPAYHSPNIVLNHIQKNLPKIQEQARGIQK